MSNFRAHYAVFFTLAGPEKYPGLSLLSRWTRLTNKRAAVAYARRVGGYVVRVGYGSTDAWDAPTFRVCGDVVADHRRVAA